MWVKELLLGRSQGVTVGVRQFRVTSRVSLRGVLGHLLFFDYVNDISRKIESNIRRYCITYWKITDSSDIDKVQTDLRR